MDNALTIAHQAMHEIESEQSQVGFSSNIRISCMNDIVEQAIEWLWKSFIALGKITVIAGNPGLGKSQLMAYIAAIVSRGLMWPDFLAIAPRGSVLILSAEDDPRDTIKPRLRAAGADLNKCYIIEAIPTKTMNGKNSERSFDLTQDIDLLEEALKDIGDVRVLIIDPITAYMGETDSHNNADVRGILAPLAAMAAKHNVAVLLITHLNKSQNQDVLARIIGSIGLIAAARAGFVIFKDNEEPSRRYFLPVKNNIGNDLDGFAYNIEGVMLENGITTSRIVWQPGKVNAQEIFNPSFKEKPITPDKATEWLRTLLTGKSLPASRVYAEADGAGFSRHKINRAKEALGIEPYKQQNVVNGPWIWRLLQVDDSRNPIEEIEGVEENDVSKVFVTPRHHQDVEKNVQEHTPQTTVSSTCSVSSEVDCEGE